MSASPPRIPSHKRKRATEDAVDAGDSGSDSSSSSEGEDDELTLHTPAGFEDDPPVLSHAAKRKQKKKEDKRKRQQQGSDEEALTAMKKKRKLKDGTAATPLKDDKGLNRKNSIWVGNMSFKTTEDNLRAFFADRAVGEITRINMPTKAAKGPGLRAENRGFAYVDFDTPETKQKAIALSEQPLLGRKLLIKDGDDFTGRPNQPVETTLVVNGAKKSLSKSAQRILKNQKQPSAPTLFFGNLGFDTTEDSIRELLEAHREKRKQKVKHNEEVKDNEEQGDFWIRKIRMGTFEDSGKCKGFAFVDFTTVEHAMSALVNPRNHHLNGRDLVVEYASAEAVRRGAPKEHRAKNRMDSNIPSGKPERKSQTRKDSLHTPKQPQHEKEGSANLNPTADGAAHLAPRPSFAPNRPERDRQTDRRNHSTGNPRGRPKPGAALALAKRESSAIVPSQGQKITF